MPVKVLNGLGAGRRLRRSAVPRPAGGLAAGADAARSPTPPGRSWRPGSNARPRCRRRPRSRRYWRLRYELDVAPTCLTSTGRTRSRPGPARCSCCRWRARARSPAAARRLELAGRASVFDGVTDFAYLPPDSATGSTGSGRIALPARAGQHGPAVSVRARAGRAGRTARGRIVLCATSQLLHGRHVRRRQGCWPAR